MATYTVKLPPTIDEVRAEKIAAIKAEAHRLLLPTDWYVVRQVETGMPMPQEVLAYRQAVRDASDVAEQEIATLQTIEEIRAYQVVWPEQ